MTLDASTVGAAATVLLVVVGIFAFAAQKLAADAARDLYEMQSRAARPNLQSWDRFDDHESAEVGLLHAPVVFYLRNYGGRPARIEEARFFIDGVVERVEHRSASVVMPGKIVRFELDWRQAPQLSELRWGDLSEGGDRQILGLSVTFSETDGTGRTVSIFSTPHSLYRPWGSTKAATLKLVDPETPLRGKMPGN